jgi:hypothetical protein
VVQADTESEQPAATDSPFFQVLRRGYDRTQVDAYIPELVARLDAAEQARAELEREVARLREQPSPTFEQLGEEAATVLQEASRSAESLIERPTVAPNRSSARPRSRPSSCAGTSPARRRQSWRRRTRRPSTSARRRSRSGRYCMPRQMRSASSATGCSSSWAVCTPTSAPCSSGPSSTRPRKRRWPKAPLSPRSSPRQVLPDPAVRDASALEHASPPTHRLAATAAGSSPFPFDIPYIPYAKGRSP